MPNDNLRKNVWEYKVLLISFANCVFFISEYLKNIELIDVFAMKLSASDIMCRDSPFCFLN